MGLREAKIERLTLKPLRRKRSEREEELVSTGRAELKAWISNLLSIAGQTAPPVNLEEIARHRRIDKIVESADRIDGLLIPTYRGFQVRIRGNLPLVRKRSTLAHEIGHTYFYDLSTSPPTKIRHWFNKVWSEEGVCSEIGRCLLVPSHMLKQVLDGLRAEPLTITVMQYLARLFSVSLDIIARRLQDENLSNAVFVFLQHDVSNRPTPQRPMISSGNLRVKGICAFLLAQEAFQNAVRTAAVTGQGQCDLQHETLGKLEAVCRRVSVDPVRVLALATRPSGAQLLLT